MIADAGVFVFDHRRFRDRVVPAIRRLHADDVAEPWLEAAWNHRRYRPAAVPRFTPYLRELTAGLVGGGDLVGELPRELWPRPAPRPKRRPRSGSGSVQADRYTTPRDHERWQQLRLLLQCAIETQCLDHGVFMGNATLPGELGSCLDRRWGPVFDQDVRPLLEYLEERASAWRHSRTDGHEGVFGWLDPDETWLLSQGLEALPLPRIEPGIDAIHAARAAGIGACGDGGDCPFRLAALRALGALAAERGRAVLWGLDLTPPDRSRFV